MTEAHDPLDAPRTPRSPLREDEPDAPLNPGEPAQDPGPQVERVTKRDDSHDIPPVQGEEVEQSAEELALQQENAGTTYDQPSQ